MHNILPIYRKENKMFFNSLMAYIIITVFLLVTGWFFSSTLFLIKQADLRMLIGMVPLIFVFFAPAISMRTIAEEKKIGSIELLTTMPTNDYEIVVGKFLSTLTVLGLAVIMTLPYAFILGFLGNIDGGAAFSSYLGLILMGGAYLSIGVLMSSLTDNQIIAFVLSFIVILALFLFGKILPFAPQWMMGTLQYLSIDYHFENVARGVIDSRDIIYYLSVIFVSLFLAKESLEARKK